MGRPKEFDRDEVLDRAVEIFRCDGFNGTSMQQLLDGMGINRFSLYDTFGDKGALFVLALDRYETRRRQQLVVLLGETGPRKPLIRRYFEDMVEETVSQPVRGCLLISSAVELANENKEVADRLYENFEKMETLFLEALQEARKTGEISPLGDLRAKARFLVSLIRAVRITAKVAPRRDVLMDIVNCGLSILDQAA